MGKFVPLRHYIFDRLYHPTLGYFCKPNFQVGQLKAPINFKSLIGYDDYQRELVEKYPANAWLTPSQIFKPYYGMTVASYIKAAHQRYYGDKSGRSKIRIVEAGGGTGSAAESILYFFSNFHRELLPLLEYTIVEISPSLCTRITKKLSKSFPHLLHNKQLKILNQDISDHKENQPCFGLFFEVLDNLPHDKVLWNASSNSYDRLCTADITNNEESSIDLQTDPLALQCLQLYQKAQQQSGLIQTSLLDKLAQFLVSRMGQKKDRTCKDLFLPTFMLRLMKRMDKNMPKCHLVISDFDHLMTTVPGINAPVVSLKGFRSEEKKDFDSYLVGRGEADIFFPTDFALLQKMHMQVLGRGAKVAKSFEFMQEFGFESWAQTKSNFNPIRQDFGNTSFLVSEILPNP